MKKTRWVLGFLTCFTASADWGQNVGEVYWAFCKDRVVGAAKDLHGEWDCLETVSGLKNNSTRKVLLKFSDFDGDTLLSGKRVGQDLLFEGNKWRSSYIQRLTDPGEYIQFYVLAARSSTDPDRAYLVDLAEVYKRSYRDGKPVGRLRGDAEFPVFCEKGNKFDDYIVFRTTKCLKVKTP